MCQLLGMSSQGKSAITFSLTGFTARGGRTADHVDGWGIAFYDESGSRLFHDDRPASSSPLAGFLRKHPIKSRTVIAHLRKATQGSVRLVNCHPFQREWQGQSWVFAANGDLPGYAPPLTGSYTPVGTTDSEKAFCWMLQCLKAKFATHMTPPTWQDIMGELVGLAEAVARWGNFNFLLSNGDALFAHCSSKLHMLHRQHPFATAKLVDCGLALDLAALNQPDDQIALIATEPLTQGEPWQAFEPGQLKVFVRGKEVFDHINPRTRGFPASTWRAVQARPLEQGELA